MKLAPQWVAVALLAATASCVSGKSDIRKGANVAGRAAATIHTEASTSHAEITSALAHELPAPAVAPLERAAERQKVIQAEAVNVQDAVADIRDGLEGVIDRPTPLWRKVLYLGLALLLAFVAVVYLAPSLLVRAIPALAGVLGRARRSGAALLAEGKVTEGIAALRTGDARFDAAWKAAKRE